MRRPRRLPHGAEQLATADRLSRARQTDTFVATTTRSALRCTGFLDLLDVLLLFIDANVANRQNSVLGLSTLTFPALTLFRGSRRAHRRKNPPPARGGATSVAAAERLRHAVVATGVEDRHFLRVGVRRRKHEDGVDDQRRTSRSNRDAFHVPQAEIEHDDSRLPGAGQVHPPRLVSAPDVYGRRRRVVEACAKERGVCLERMVHESLDRSCR